jgi:hypothetical protein
MKTRRQKERKKRKRERVKETMKKSKKREREMDNGSLEESVQARKGSKQRDFRKSSCRSAIASCKSD